MPIDARFHFARLSARAGTRMPALRQELEGDLLPRLADSGIAVWGVWAGMFGIASTEVILVTSCEDGQAGGAGLREAVGAWDGVELADGHGIAPTVRPHGTSRLTREGLYVFRYFDILRSDVDEFVRLSEQGWVAFERAGDFAAEPQGLFVREDSEGSDTELATMLLCTWYDGLGSWQHSRPLARSDFAARAALTLSTVAYATRLLPPLE